MLNGLLSTFAELAEEARILHYRVATAENGEISDGRGEVYKTSLRLFFVAIAKAYPKLDVARIYDVWADCNESVAYCAEYVEKEMQYERDVRNFCLTWHKGCDLDKNGICYMPLEKDEEDNQPENG